MMSKTRLTKVLMLGLFALISLGLIYWMINLKNANDKISQTQGVHGGVRLIGQDFEVEMVLQDKDKTGKFKAYVSLTEPGLKNFSLKVTTTRLKNIKQTYEFTQDKPGIFYSNEPIPLPWSFDIRVDVMVNHTPHIFQFSHYEGRVSLSDAVAKISGVRYAKAQAHEINHVIYVVGKILPNRDTLASIYPRYPGLIKSLRKSLGDEIKKGEVLVTIESNESLQNYDIVAPIDGTIVLKQVALGELAKGDMAIYEIADLNTVWAQLTLYRKESERVKKGMVVVVTRDDGQTPTEAKIDYISPLGIEDTQTISAFATLANEAREWLPGMYINAMITIKTTQARCAVPTEAIQKWHGKTVVFVKEGIFYEATPVVLGAQNEQWTEILSGIDVGTEVVTSNSFLIKADIDKAGAHQED